MKKKSGIILGICLILLCGLIFSACGTNYAGIILNYSVDGITGEEAIELVVGLGGSKQIVITPENLGGVDSKVELTSSSDIIMISSASYSGDSTIYTITALAGGKASIRARLLAGAESNYIDIDVNAIVPIEGLTAQETASYVLEGEGNSFTLTSTLINFEPLTTTQTGVNFYMVNSRGEVDSEPTTSFEAYGDILTNYLDSNSNIKFKVVSKSNLNISTEFFLRVVRAIDVNVEYCDNNKDVEAGATSTSLVLNYTTTYSQKYIKITAVSLERNISLGDIVANGYVGVSLESYACVLSEQTGKYVSTFMLKLDANANTSGKIEIKLPELIVGGQFMVDKNLSASVEVYSLMQYIYANNNAMSDIASITAFNNTTSSSLGTKITLSSFPISAKEEYSYVKIAYNDNDLLFTLYYRNGNKIASGAVLSANSSFYVRGNDGASGSGTVQFTPCNAKGETNVNADIFDEGDLKLEVEVVKGATTFDNYLADTLYFNYDPTMTSATIINIKECLNRVQGEAYSEQNISVGDLSFVYFNTGISLTQTNSNATSISVLAFQEGAGKFRIILGNGLYLDFNYYVVNEVVASSVGVSVPTPLNSNTVSQITQNGENEYSIVMQKWTSLAGNAPISVLYSTAFEGNASIGYEWLYNGNVLSASDPVCIQNGNLVANEVGDFVISLSISYKDISNSVSGYAGYSCQVVTITFTFNIKVYVATTSFSLTSSNIDLDNIDSVGYKNIDLAQCSLVFTGIDLSTPIYFSSKTVTDDKYIEIIEFGEVSGNVCAGSDIMLSINEDGKAIVRAISRSNRSVSVSFVYHEYGKTFTTTLKINVSNKQKVSSINVSNFDLTNGISLTDKNSYTAQILAFAYPSDAYNGKLIYSFVADEASNDGKIVIDSNGAIKLSQSASATDTITGVIVVAAEDSLTSSGQYSTYISIPVRVENGKTFETAFSIDSAEDLLMLNNATEGTYYKLIGTINVASIQSSLPLNNFSAILFGNPNSSLNKIVGIEISGLVCGLFSSITESGIIANISFSGTISGDFASDAKIGLIAGTNSGNIIACSALLNNTSSHLIENALSVGVMVGENYGSIISSGLSTIDSSLTQTTSKRFVYVSSDARLCVISCTNVGAVCGVNAGTITGCYSGSDATFNKSNYTAILDIYASGCTTVGMIAGESSGEISNVAVDGTINALYIEDSTTFNNYVGGIAGSADKIDTALSNVYVEGGVNIGGIAGKILTSISNCAIEAYANDGATNGALKVNATDATAKGVFASNESESNISINASYAYNYSGSDNGNADLISFGTESTVYYYGDISGENKIPTEASVTIKKQQLGSLTTAVYIILDKKINLDEMINIYLTNYFDIPSSCSAINQSTSVLVNNNDGSLGIVGLGLAEILITSYYNPSLSLTVYILVVDKITNDTYYSTVSGIRYYLNGNQILLLKDENVTFSNDYTSSNNGTNDIAIGYTSAGDTEKFLSVTNFANYFVLYGTEALGSVQCKIYRAVSATIGETVYSSYIDTGKSFYIEIKNGVRDIKTDFEEYVVMPNDSLTINGSVLTDIVSSIDVYIDVYIDGIKLTSSSMSLTIGDSEFIYYPLSYAFDLTIYKDIKKQQQIEITFVYTQTNVSKTIKVTVVPQKTTAIDITNYTTIEDYIFNNSSIAISPSIDGLMSIKIVPDNSQYDCVYILNNAQNAYQISFELYSYKGGSFSQVAGAEIVDGGIKIKKELIENSSLLIRTTLTSDVPNNTLLIVDVKTDKDFVVSKELYCKEVNYVNLHLSSREENADNTYDVAKNLQYEIALDIKGYDFSELTFTCSDTCSDQNTSINIVNNVAYVKIANITSWTSTEPSVEIRVYGSKVINGITYVSEIKSMKLIIHQYVIVDYSFENVIHNGTSYVYNLPALSETTISLDKSVSGNIEYDHNDTTIVNNVNTLINALDNGIYSNLVKYGDYSNEYFNEIDNIRSTRKITNKKLYDNSQMNIYFELTYSYNYKNGEASFDTSGTCSHNDTLRFEFDLYQRTDTTSYISVGSYEELIAMNEGNNYRLTAEITLEETFSPITAKILRLDGNGYKIIFPANLTIDTYSFALFSEIDDGAIIENLTLVIPESGTKVTSAVDDLTIALMAVENYGSIYNCQITGGTLTIITEENIATTANISFGGFIVNNYGYLMNSRNTLKKTTVYGNVAGLVVNNYKIISSCRVTGVKIKSSQEASNVFVAGVAITNGSSAKITNTYIAQEIGESLSNSLTNAYLKSKSSIAGFIYTNSGEISDCYSDIGLDSSKLTSGFVFINSEGATITNCYSSCYVVETVNTYPFVGVINESATSQQTTIQNFGTIYGCHYLYNSSYKLNENVEGLTYIINMASQDSFDTFAINKNSSSIWLMGSIKPTLVSADNVIAITKFVLKDATMDNNTNLLVYNWTLNGVSNAYRGDGTQANPFVVSTAEELNSIFENQNSVNWYVRLIADIDYEDYNEMLINTYLITFSGVFDGNGCTIKNYIINSTNESTGFFGSIGTTSNSAVIKNLVLIPKQVNSSSSSYVGTVAGTSTNSGIYGVYVNGTTANSTRLTLIGKYRVGGLVGYAISTTIVSCKSTVSVYATACSQSSDYNLGNNSAINLRTNVINKDKEREVSYAGGIVGYAENSTITFANVTSSIAIIGQIIGGIAGRTKNSGSITSSQMVIDNQSVFRPAFIFGGIVGYNEGAITDCFVSSSVNGTIKELPAVAVFVGGIVGYNVSGDITYTSDVIIKTYVSSENFSYVGGIVGYLKHGNIINTNGATITVANSITGGTYVGGAVGYIEATGGIKISNIIISGNVISSSSLSYTGGIVGYINLSTCVITIDNCTVASKYITASTVAGGVVGEATASSAEATITITNCQITAPNGLIIKATSKGSYAGEIIGKYFTATLDENATNSVSTNVTLIASGPKNYALHYVEVFFENNVYALTQVSGETTTTTYFYANPAKNGVKGFKGTLTNFYDVVNNNNGTLTYGDNILTQVDLTTLVTITQSDNTLVTITQSDNTLAKNDGYYVLYNTENCKFITAKNNTDNKIGTIISISIKINSVEAITKNIFTVNNIKSSQTYTITYTFSE